MKKYTTPLNFPTYNFRMKKSEEKFLIFDIVRKKFIVLQPEEWVRQHLLHFLTEEKNYPIQLLRVEVAVNTKLLKQRSDIIAYDRNGKALLIVECKAPHIKITQDTFDQIARYNMKLRVPYLLVTNGLQHYCCIMDYEKESYTFLQEIPNYKEIT